MGLFNKKEEKVQGVPTLPELPSLPDFPKSNFNMSQIKVDRLPSYPSNSYGDKFSQDAIKEAVSGKEEVKGGSANEFAYDRDEESFLPEYNEEDMQEMQLPPEELKKEMFQPRKIKNYSEEVPMEFRSTASRLRREEPLFIRIDKFQESLGMFEKIREKVNEVEGMLGNIQKIKEEEEKELILWEKELQIIKQQIEKIDSGVFSKIE